MTVLIGLIEMFLIGLGTPLTAVCVIPLYPAFVAYLGSVGGEDRVRSSPLALGLMVFAGVLAFMTAVGVVVSFVLVASIEGFVGIVSPVAFTLLLAIGLIMLADREFFARVPQIEPPQTRYPAITAFGYGFFFGAIIIPCNPGLIALAFSRNPVLFDTQLESFLGFLLFGVGIGVPLFGLAIASESFGRRLTTWIATHSTGVNRVTGVILVGVSLYYLLVVFQLVPLPEPVLEMLKRIPIPTGSL